MNEDELRVSGDMMIKLEGGFHVIASVVPGYQPRRTVGTYGKQSYAYNDG